MATKPRIIVPGVIYQVCSIGVHELQMFKKDEIKSFFLKLLEKTLKKYDFTCLAFSISLNQYNMVIQSGQKSISLAMQTFNSILAKKVNKVLNREGTAFSSRFKSGIVENERLKELVRAVHLEPVQLGEMSLDELIHYKYCSHSIIMGNNTSDLIDKDAVLKQMGIDSVEKYSQFIKNIDSDDEITSKLKMINSAKQGFQKPQLWVIGKPEFVEQVIDGSMSAYLLLVILAKCKNGKIHEKVANILIMEKEDLYRAVPCQIYRQGTFCYYLQKPV